jgi:hypothetical protein
MGGRYHPTSKIKSINLVKHEFGESGPVYLRVTYGKDVYNDGTFNTYKDFKNSIDAWTDKQQLEYVGGQW